MPDQLETALNALRELCWQCRLVDWLGGLEQDAAVSLIVGVLNAGAILGAALWATNTARDVFSQRAAHRISELSEQVLSLVYQAEDIFGDLRSPYYFVPLEDMKLSLDEREQNKINKRLERTRLYFDKCNEIRPALKAYFDKKTHDLFYEISALRSKYIFAAESYLNELKTNNTTKYTERTNELLNIIISSENNDEIRGELIRIEKNLEEKLMPYIRRKQ